MKGVAPTERRIEHENLTEADRTPHATCDLDRWEHAAEWTDLSAGTVTRKMSGPRPGLQGPRYVGRAPKMYLQHVATRGRQQDADECGIDQRLILQGEEFNAYS